VYAKVKNILVSVNGLQCLLDLFMSFSESSKNIFQFYFITYFLLCEKNLSLMHLELYIVKTITAG